MTDEKNFIKSGNALVGGTLEQGECKEILKKHNNSLTFSIWTMAGTVLAACTSPIFGDIADLAGGGGGGGDTQSGATVPARTFDGPVDGARFFMDENRDGVYTEDIDIDLGTTNGVGRAEIAPPQIGAVVYADVNGALDIATGEILSGVWQSLPYDGSGQVLISPLTDLLARQLIDPTNADDVTDMGQDAFLQDVLDDILGKEFGVTVADVLNHENYNPVGLADAPLERQIITTAAIELTVVYENAADATDSATARGALKTAVGRFTIDTDTMTVSSATPEVQNRLGDAQDRGDFPVVAEVNGGEPIRMTEDQDFTLVSGNAERLFGFEDPLALGGEEDSLVGIYIQAASTDGNVNVMFRNAENGIVALADADRGVVASTPAPYDNTFFYVSAENFGRLILRPDTNFNTENNPNPEIRFYVYDGEHTTAIVENAGELLGVGELEIAVASVNDAPELTVNAVDDAVTEAGGLNNAAIGDAMANGSLTITDPDTGHNAFTFAGNTLQGRAGTSGAFKNANGVDEGGVTSDGQIMGTYGTLTLERDGTWSYALRDDDPDTQALDGGNTPDMVQDVFQIQLVNVDGTTQTSAIVPITIDVTGADDATTITSPASDFGPFEVVDPSRTGTDDAPTATGTFSASDPDDDITWSGSATGANSGLGTVTFVGNRWTFTLTDPAGVRALNDLASGDTTDITFDIAANGVDAGRDLTITLRGAADTTIPAPVIGAFTGNIADADPASDTNAPAPVSGTFSPGSGDVDRWMAVPRAGATEYGTIVVTGSQWTFTLNAAGITEINRLDAGETTDAVFDVTATNAGGADTSTLTISLTGIDDNSDGPTQTAPEIPAFTGSIVDDDPASDTNTPAPVSGTFSTTSGTANTWAALPQAGATEYGTISVTGAQWTFTLNAAGRDEINRLDAGGTTDVIFDVTATNAGGDGTSTLTISLTGIEDNSDGPTQTAPEIPAFTGSITDADPASDTNTPAPVSGTFATSSGTADTWMAEPRAGATEYGTIVVTGAQWTFTLNAAGRDEINRLDAGETTDAVFDVTATNTQGNGTSTLTISLTGIVDNSDTPAPVIGAFTGSIADADPASDTNTPAPVSGTFSTTSGTANTWAALPQAGATEYGTIVVTGARWTFTLNAAGITEINTLDAGDTTDAVFDVTATNAGGDGTSTLTISLTGIDDNSDTTAPVIAAFTSSIVDDDAASDTNTPAPVSGTFSTTSGTAEGWTAVPQAGATEYGTIVVTGAQWTFTLNAAGRDEINTLDAGDTTDAVFDVTATNAGGDGTSTLTISLTGIDDNSDGPTQTVPVIGAFTGSITDADPASDTNTPDPVSGTFSTTSGTADGWMAVPQAGATEYGTIVVTGARWTFTLNAAGITEINRLDAGETADAVFDVTATNTQGADESTLTISLTGIEDNSDTPAPVIPAFTGSIADADPASDTNAPAPVSGTFATTSGTADGWMAVPRAGATEYGTIVVTGAQWTFTLNAAGISEINRLDAGETTDAVFDVTAENVGGDDTSTLTISLTGIVDNSDTPAPVIPAFTGSIADADPASDTNTPAPVSGTFATTSGAADGWMAVPQAGTTEYGTIVVTGSQWTFTLNAAGITEINRLDAGDTPTQAVFDVTAENVGGSDESTLTISLTGIEDNSDTPAPVIGAFTGSITDDDPASDTNAPAPVSGTFSTTSGTADGWMAVPQAGATEYGTIVVTGAQWTFTLNAAGITEINTLDAGGTTDAVFDVTATNVGGAAESTLTISLTGIVDNSDTPAPVIPAFTGSIADADPASDTNTPNPVSGTFSTTSGTADGWMAVPRAGTTEYGTIVVTGTQWTFTLNATGIAEINTLDAGDTPAQAVFDVTATNVGGADESTLTISLTGIDDNSDTSAPVIGAFTGSIADADPASDTNAPNPVSGTFSTTSGTADGWMAVPRAGATEYGTIVVTGTQWTFTLNAAGIAEINTLDAGDTPAQAVFDVTATNVGGSAESTLTISLTGIDDNSDTTAPVIPAFTGSIADADPASDTNAPNPVSGTFSTTSGTADGWMAVPRAGTTEYGTIVVTGTQWTFTLNAAGITEINRLDAGDTPAQAVFDVTATNVGGADRSTLTISLTGIVDNSDTPAPVIPAFTGSIADADPASDTNAPNPVSGTFSTTSGTADGWMAMPRAGATEYGTIVVTGSQWTFTLNATGIAEINRLDAGDTPAQAVFDVTATNVGGADESTLTISLTGIEDNSDTPLPVIVTGSQFDALTIADTFDDSTNNPDAIDGAFTATGTVTEWSYTMTGFTGDTNGRPAADFGSFTLMSNGEWTFDPTAAINMLTGSQSVTFEYAITAANVAGSSAPETFTITLQGLALPVLGEEANAEKTATEAGHELDNGVTVAAPSIAAMGSFTHTDANAGQGGFVGGTVHIKTDSALDNAYAAGLGSNTGNNIGGTDRGTAVIGTYGTIYLRADGDWYYVLDDARTDINALTDGASSLVDEFEVRIQEMEDPTIVSNVLELTISIAGKNDAPSSITASSTTTTYSGTAPPPGHIIATLTSTDPDSDSTGNTYTYAIDMNSADAPSFMIIGNQLQFASSGAVDRNAGDSWTVGVISTASDGLSRTETFTIMRAGNAAPTDIITDVAGTSAALTATYDGDDVPIGGHLVATFSDSIDVNADDTHRYSIVPSTVDDSGLFTIRGGNQLVLLAGSPTLGDTLEVTVRTTDAGTGAGGLTFDKTFTITRAGNVSPTDITTTDALTVTYDGNDLPSDGRRVLTLGTTDLNADDSHTYSITGGMHAPSFAISGNELRLATSGGVSVAPGGTWQVTITTTDSGTGVGGLMFEEDFTITRAGNAFPEINTGTSGTAYDSINSRFIADVTDPNRGDTASAPTATGMIVAEDFETAAAAITYSAARAQGETNNYGSITFDPANPGAWTFTLTTSAQVSGGNDGVTVLNALASATNTAVMDFTVTATDADSGTDTATLRITLRGAPAAIPPPAITAGDMAGTITDDDFRDHENIPASDSGMITATGSDIEWSSVITGISGLTGDLASRSAADFGSLTLTPSVNGNSVEWVFTPTALINELRAADTNVMITYTITARNGGGEVPTTLTINLDGANDAPVLTQAEHAPPGVIIDKSVMEAGGSNNDVAGDTMARGSLINTDIDMGQSGFGAGTGNTVQGAAGTSPTDADFNALGNDDAEGGKGTRITGVYGDLFLKNDGTWTYELDDDRDATQSLNGPDTNILADRVQDVFTIRVQNVDDTDTKVSNEVEISIDVTGADDDLVLDDLGSLATIDGARVDEIIAELAGPNRGNAYIFGDDNDGAGPNVNQIFTARDPDSRDADLVWSVEALSLPSTADTVYVDLAEYGMFEVDEETGDWRFLFTSAGRRAFDEIDFTGTGVGEDNGLRVIPVRVTVTNDRGISVSDTFEITLEGRAEAPMIADENSNDFNVIFSTPPTSTLSGEVQAFDPDMPLDPQDPGLVWTHAHTGGDDTLVDFQFMGVLNQSTGFTEGSWTLTLTPAGETRLSQRGGDREDITYRITVADNNGNTDTEDFTITLSPPSSDVPPATGLVDLLPGADVNLQFGYDHFGQGQFGFARGGGALPDASVFTDSGDDDVDIQIGGQLAEPFTNPNTGQFIVAEPIHLFTEYTAVEVPVFGIPSLDYNGVADSRTPVPFRYSTDNAGIVVFQNRSDVTYDILNPNSLVIPEADRTDFAAHRDKSSPFGELHLFPDGRWTYNLFTDPGRAGKNSGTDYYRITYRRIDSGVIQENDHDIGVEERTGLEISDTYILRINVAAPHALTFTNTINRFFNEKSEGIITGLFDDVDRVDIRQYGVGGLDAAREGSVAREYVDTTPRGDEVGIFEVDSATGVFTYNFTGGGRAAIEARLIHTDVGNDPIIKREIPVWGVDKSGNIGTTMVEVSISGLFRLQVQASSPDITSMPDRSGIYPNTLAIGDHRDNTLTLGTSLGRNFIFAHEGSDTINLAVDGPDRDSPEDVIYHRFSSAHDSWVNYDGADTINNFDRATDTFILVDRDTGSDVDEPEIFGSGTQLQIHAIFGNNGADKDSLAGFTLRFSNDANSVITFNYLTPRNVSNSAEAARFFGNGRASLDESDGNRITDHGLFEVYFGGGHFQVIEELPQYLNDYTDTDIIFRPIDDPADQADRFITGAGDGEILIGDSRDNTIRPAGGQDHIVGGRGDDEISLSFGDDSVYHRFSSDSANWINIDGSDHITGFRRREDAFIFLDIDTTSTVDEAAIKGANTELQLFAILEDPATISGVYLVFENDLGGVVRIDYRQDERITITAGNEADFFGTSPNTTSLYNNDGEMLTIRRVTDLSGIGNFFGDSDDQFQVLSQLPRILADILPEISNIGDDIPMDSGTATPGPAIQPFTLSPANEFTHDTLTHGELIFTAFRGGDTTPPTVDRPQVGIELTFGGVPGSGVNVTAIGTGGDVVTIDIVVATDLMDGAQAVTWQTIRDAVNTNGHTAQHVRVSYAAGADGTGAPDAFDTLYADRNGKLSGGEGTPEMPAMDAVALTPDTATFGDLTFTSIIEGDSRLHDVKQVRLIFTDSATGADPIVSVNDSSNSVTDITISVNRNLDATTWDEVLRAYNEHTASTAPNGVTTPAASRVAAITTSTGFDLSQSLGNYFAARPSVDNHFTQAGAAARLVLDGGAGATALVEVAPTFNMLAPRDWPFEFTSVKAGRTWRDTDAAPADFAPKIEVDLVFRGGNNRDPFIRSTLLEEENNAFNPDPNKTRTTLKITVNVSDNMMNANGTPTTWRQINDLLVSDQYIGDDRNNIADGELFTFRVPDLNVLGDAIVSTDALDADLFGGAGREGVPAIVDVFEAGPLRFSSLSDGAEDSSGVRTGKSVRITVNQTLFTNEGNNNRTPQYNLLESNQLVDIEIDIADSFITTPWRTIADIFTNDPLNRGLSDHIKFEVIDPSKLDEGIDTALVRIINVTGGRLAEEEIPAVEHRDAVNAIEAMAATPAVRPTSAVGGQQEAEPETAERTIEDPFEDIEPISTVFVPDIPDM